MRARGRKILVDPALRRKIDGGESVEVIALEGMEPDPCPAQTPGIAGLRHLFNVVCAAGTNPPPTTWAHAFSQ